MSVKSLVSQLASLTAFNRDIQNSNFLYFYYWIIYNKKKKKKKRGKSADLQVIGRRDYSYIHIAIIDYKAILGHDYSYATMYKDP